VGASLTLKPTNTGADVLKPSSPARVKPAAPVYPVSGVKITDCPSPDRLAAPWSAPTMRR
jgi:hypothetical protein